jgi:PAS domain S-box-containing protein
VLAASDPQSVDTVPPEMIDFQDLQKEYWFVNLWRLIRRSENFGTTRTLGVANRTLFKVSVIIKSDFVRSDVEPLLANLGAAFGTALLVAIFLGSVLPNVVLDPLDRMSTRIDSILAGRFEADKPVNLRETREFADVQTKLNLLGEQFRGAKQDALEMRSNVEQLLQELEEVVLFFDDAGRLMMAGEPAERLLGKKRVEMIGRGVEEIFPASGELGQVIDDAVREHRTVEDRSVTVQRDGVGPLNYLVSVQPLRNGGEDIGTLVTMRDAESRRELEKQLDLSSRLAALSRLTSGVAHEIKNPLNAMALQLEVLRSRLEGEQPEVDVIASEIKRLDNVVKTFLNFNRPIELRAVPIDLSEIVKGVFTLISAEASAKQIHLETSLQEHLVIHGDAELLQQAILNVVKNGIEAMTDGGKLGARTAFEGDECTLDISDAGPGIPPEIRDKIFNLYFTTKKNGTGIGLATTFRVVYLHSGSIAVDTDPGKGTTFRFRFPRMVDYRKGTISAVMGS